MEGVRSVHRVLHPTTLRPSLGSSRLISGSVTSVLLTVSVAGTACLQRTSRVANDQVAVTSSPPRTLGQPRNPGVLVIAALGEAHDVAAAGGSTIVAASGAVILYGDASEPAAFGWGDGLGTTTPTTACALGRGVAIGGADGSLTLVEGRTARTLRLAGEAIEDLATDEHTLYAATREGLIAWNVGSPRATRYFPGADITALALGHPGVAASLADGSVAILNASGDVRVVPPPPAAEVITALAWVGDTLWAGR